MPSLTAQSIKVIAQAYLIIYNQSWDLVDGYESDYQNPYLESWETYTQDIHPEVHNRVKEWRNYMEPAPVREPGESETELPTKAGTLEFRGREYDCYPTIDGDFFVLKRSVYSATGNLDVNSYQLYIEFNEPLNSEALSNNVFKWKKDKSGWRIRNAGLEWSFDDWLFAQHRYPAKEVTLNIEAVDENQYNIKGFMLLDNPNDDVVHFSYTGLVQHSLVDIAVAVSEDGGKGNGTMTVGAETIETPFAARDYGGTKVFIMDRMLFMDGRIDYAVSFAIHSDKRDLPAGTLVYNKDSSGLSPSFFEQGEIQSIEEALLKITKTKLQKNDMPGEYKLEYTLKLSDGRIINGSYEGTVEPYDTHE
jgi:hypothetical protein